MGLELKVTGRTIRVFEYAYQGRKKTGRTQIASVSVGEDLGHLQEGVKEQVEKRLEGIAAEHAESIVADAVAAMDAARVAMRHAEDTEPLRAATSRLAESIGMTLSPGSQRIDEPSQRYANEEPAQKIFEIGDLLMWMDRYAGAAGDLGVDVRRQLLMKAKTLVAAIEAVPDVEQPDLDDPMPVSAPPQKPAPAADVGDWTWRRDAAGRISSRKVEDLRMHRVHEEVMEDLEERYPNAALLLMMSRWQNANAGRLLGRDAIDVDVDFRRYVEKAILEENVRKMINMEVPSDIDPTIVGYYNGRHIDWTPVSEDPLTDLRAFAAQGRMPSMPHSAPPAGSGAA